MHALLSRWIAIPLEISSAVPTGGRHIYLYPPDPWQRLLGELLRRRDP